MHDAIVEMTEKRLGVVGVTDGDGRLVGVITDGDLRRNIERGLDHQRARLHDRRAPRRSRPMRWSTRR